MRAEAAPHPIARRRSGGAHRKALFSLPVRVEAEEGVAVRLADSRGGRRGAAGHRHAEGAEDRGEVHRHHLRGREGRERPLSSSAQRGKRQAPAGRGWARWIGPLPHLFVPFLVEAPADRVGRLRLFLVLAGLLADLPEALGRLRGDREGESEEGSEPRGNGNRLWQLQAARLPAPPRACACALASASVIPGRAWNCEAERAGCGPGRSAEYEGTFGLLKLYDVLWAPAAGCAAGCARGCRCGAEAGGGRACGMELYG